MQLACTFTMASVGQQLDSAIEYYRNYLITWYETEYGQHIQTYSDTNLKIVASFHGYLKLLQEYEAEMTDLWGAVGVANDTDLDGFDLTGIWPADGDRLF